MKRTSKFFVVMLLAGMVSVASAGIFACEIDCATAHALQAIGHAEPCGGHGHMPSHAPSNDKGGQQHTGHSHSRIIAAAHASVQRTTLQQIGILPQPGGASALPRLTCTERIDFAAAKPPSLAFTIPVLRI
jgi:hypothetical protein